MYQDVNAKIYLSQPVGSMPPSGNMNCCASTLPADRIHLSSILRQALSLGLRVPFRKAASFALRLIAYPRLSLHWYRFLAQFADTHQLGRPHDDIIRKSIANFFVRKITPRQRLKLLKTHFQIAGLTMSTDDLKTLWHGGQLNCGIIAGKQEKYAITLRLSDHAGARHEGGFTCRLYRCSDETLLCMVSFIFVMLESGVMTLAIGGLQGANSVNIKQIVICSTRDLHGLRPKDAVLLIIEGMAAAIGADHFFCVSNARHVINFRSHRRRLRMSADLDQYWLERGGHPDRCFGYIMPLRNQNLQQMTSKRDLCKLQFLKSGSHIAAHNCNDNQYTLPFSEALKR